jgi:hypothetical protein
MDSPLTIVNVIFSLLLTGFGVFGLARQLRDLRGAWSSQRWPKGEAVIVRAVVQERRGSRGRTVFEPTIEFSYAVRQREHVGHRLMFGDVAARTRSYAEKLLDRFGVGTVWEVSICEARPELSVLHPGPTRRLWFGVAFFAAYTSFAVAFLIDSLGRVAERIGSPAV